MINIPLKESIRSIDPQIFTYFKKFWKIQLDSSSIRELMHHGGISWVQADE